MEQAAILGPVRSDCLVEQRMGAGCKGRCHGALEAVVELKMAGMIRKEHNCLWQMEMVAGLPVFEMRWMETRPEQLQVLGEVAMVVWLFAERRKGQWEVVEFLLVDLRMEMLQAG